MAVAALEALPPLCVDLDGTLIRGDLLLESLMLLIKRNPLYLLRVPFWLLRGKAALKAEVAAKVELDPAALPYNREFIQWLESERSNGRALWLCTASNQLLAERVASHLGIFAGVMASDGDTNLAGARKAELLAGRFGERGFDYCGNETRDLLIWRHARGAIIVRGGARLERAAAGTTSVLRAFPETASPLRAVLKALRPHQWAKNALILVPLLAAHRAGDRLSLVDGLLAVVAFSLCASSVYVLNDLLDLAADRGHPRKSKRPFAAGDLSILTGLTLAPILLLAAIAIAAFLPGKFQLVFATYYITTLAYSFALKGVVLVDALALAGLYTLRIIAGAAAVSVPLSFWLLLFSVFLFLSLAFVKRFAELDALRRQQRLRAVGRGYHIEDLSILQSLGTASGYLSVLVLALYINSPDIQSLYHRPKFIWMLCVLMLYWVSRVWMTAQRGAMHDDPVVFALKDRASLVIGLLAVITVSLAVELPSQLVSSWGQVIRAPHQVFHPLSRLAPFPKIADAANILPYGNGRSYGDSCLNAGAALLHTKYLDRFIGFDPDSGVLICESGTQLADILKLAVPKGWFVPVTPGTRFVTVGGAIANNVHGKNHHRTGTFCRHVRRFELLRSDGQRLICSTDLNAPWFAATAGGLGLTGLITWVELQLRRIPGPWMEVETIRFADLDEFLELCAHSDHDYEYTVAWVDCLESGSQLGRGLFQRANHCAERGTGTGQSRFRSIPLTPPFSLINEASVRAFNPLYYHRQLRDRRRSLEHFESFFYPLDGILHWNRLYGPRGMYQYQCVVPGACGREAIAALLETTARSGFASFLAVLKQFGSLSSPGMLSFPREGLTLAIDFPNRGEPLEQMFRQLDSMVQDAGGRLYPAKDGRMPGRLFRAGFPGWLQFREFIDPRCSSSFWRRVMEDA